MPGVMHIYIYVHPAAGRQICHQPLFAGGGGARGRRGGIATPNTPPCLPVMPALGCAYARPFSITTLSIKPAIARMLL